MQNLLPTLAKRARRVRQFIKAFGVEIGRSWRALWSRAAARITWLPRLVARVPAPIHTKLLVALLASPEGS
jgi:hypothetical protein